jgi:predicted nucleic acid-binding protein
MISSGSLQPADLDSTTTSRMEWLMGKYRDVPMSLADSSLVAVAEVLNQRSVFTLDAHFRVYRFRDRGHFDVLP